MLESFTAIPVAIVLNIAPSITANDFSPTEKALSTIFFAFMSKILRLDPEISKPSPPTLERLMSLIIPSQKSQSNASEDVFCIFNPSIEIEFLTWNDCMDISANNLFTFGSHSVNHRLLSKLTDAESFKELKDSKYEIEDRLKIKCQHFAPPVGDYISPRDINFCKEIGYKSLSTTERGKMDDLILNPYSLKRQHLLAIWDLNYLNFFFNK